MKVLVLGGNQFLSREVAVQGIERGWDMACACRGQSGAVPHGAKHLRWDRAERAPEAIVCESWDAVVDVSGTPSHVRRATEALSTPHWVYVSTVSVYLDDSSPAMEPVVAPVFQDVDLATSPDAYGGMKVACEQIVQSATESSVVVRPGLIVGPQDISGRFAYWPQRMVRGGEILAPGGPDDLLQVIDVRDLASWLLDLAAARTTTVFDAVGETLSFEALLREVTRGLGTDLPNLTWVPSEFLEIQGVRPWMGPDSIPLWLPRPQYNGLVTHDPTPAFDAGLRTRSIAETAVSCLESPVVALSAEREADLLRAWHAQLTSEGRSVSRWPTEAPAPADTNRRFRLDG